MIVKKKKKKGICQIVDFAISAHHKVKLKECNTILNANEIFLLGDVNDCVGDEADGINLLLALTQPAL